MGLVEALQHAYTTYKPFVVFDIFVRTPVRSDLILATLRTKLGNVKKTEPNHATPSVPPKNPDALPFETQGRMRKLPPSTMVLHVSRAINFYLMYGLCSARADRDGGLATSDEFCRKLQPSGRHHTNGL